MCLCVLQDSWADVIFSYQCSQQHLSDVVHYIHLTETHSFVLFVCLSSTHTYISVYLFNSSFNFVFCIEGCSALNPGVSLCLLNHWFLCFCVPGVHLASWVSIATTRTLVNLATVWMEGTAQFPCQLVYLYQAAPPAPALLASLDSTAKLPKIPHVTPTTPVPTKVSAPCCPSTSTSASVPEDGQVRNWFCHKGSDVWYLSITRTLMYF